MSGLRFVPVVAAVLALHAALAAGQQAPALRTLASFSGERFTGIKASPNGRFVLLCTPASLRMYEVASRQSWTLVEAGTSAPNWSPRGDLIAFVRPGDRGEGSYVWVMPVDANTGRPRSPAQRLALGEGEFAAFSLDSRWVALTVDDSGQGKHLSILPATGGPERVLARALNFSAIYWGADGRAIYVGGRRRAEEPGGNVFRIRVSDGATEVIRSEREWIAGMTADRRHILVVPNRAQLESGDRGTVIDTAGREVGHFPVPAEGVAARGVLGDSALVWATYSDDRALEVRPSAGGTARRLPLIGESDDVPKWSPDGTRIVFQVREGDRTSLAVMDADGSHPRVFPGAEVSWGVFHLAWSPDSRFVAFVGPGARSLSLLDVAAGTVRTLAQDSVRRIFGCQWRVDGQAVVFSAFPRVGSSARGSIDEVTTSGRRRRLLDLPVFPRGQTGMAFAGGPSAFVRSDSAAFLRPLGAGPMRRLAGVPPGTEVGIAVMSSDLRWVAGLLFDPSRPAWNQIELYSLKAGGRMVLDLPFRLYGYRPEYVPRDSVLLVFGQRTGETGIKLFRVPLNGDRPSVFAEIGTPHDYDWPSGASASPDGRWVVYAVQPEEATWSLRLIDLRGAVPRATSPAPLP